MQATVVLSLIYAAQVNNEARGICECFCSVDGHDDDEKWQE